MKDEGKIPDKCTLCGGSFELDNPASPLHGKRVIYPYPMKEWLCQDCFRKSLDAGLNRLNKVLAGQPLTKEDFQSPEEAVIDDERED